MKNKVANENVMLYSNIPADTIPRTKTKETWFETLIIPHMKQELLEEEKRMTALIEADPELNKYHVTTEMDHRMTIRLEHAKAERAAFEALPESEKEAIIRRNDAETIRCKEPL